MTRRPASVPGGAEEGDGVAAHADVRAEPRVTAAVHDAPAGEDYVERAARHQGLTSP